MKPIASRTFRSDDCEVVRLPHEIAFGAEIDVMIERSGNLITIRPRQDVEADQARFAQMVNAVHEMRLPKKLPVAVELALPADVPLKREGAVLNPIRARG